MAARITVADLAAQLAELTTTVNTRLDAQDSGIAVVAKAMADLAAQFSTPAPVAEAVSAPVAKRTPRKAAAKAAKVTAPVVAITSAPSAKAATTAAEREAASAAWKAEKAAVSPVNKALVKILGTASGDAWDARWTNLDAISAALATLTVEQQQAALPHVQKRVNKAARA